MAQILVRDLDDKVVRRLKTRARRAGRSLQSEVKAVLEEAAQLDPRSALALADKIRKSFRRRRFSNSAVLIRRDRDR